MIALNLVNPPQIPRYKPLFTSLQTLLALLMGLFVVAAPLEGRDCCHFCKWYVLEGVFWGVRFMGGWGVVWGGVITFFRPGFKEVATLLRRNIFFK